VIAARPAIALGAAMLKTIGVQRIRPNAHGIPCGMFVHLPATKFSLHQHHLCNSDNVDYMPAEPASPADRALAAGVPQEVGWFKFYFADERWEWSTEAERIHGYEPGTAHPTTTLVLSHKHPDDLEHIAATIEDIRHSYEPFSTRHRIVTTHGEVREVIVIGERLYDNTGVVVGSQGFYVDVTPNGREETISRAVSGIVASRAAIERVKGILMFVYRIEAEHAFEILKWRSQVANVKVRSLAEHMITEIRAWEYGENLPSRSTFDQLLLTVHRRMPTR
jgi:PAS domain S-box-containing protein